MSAFNYRNPAIMRALRKAAILSIVVFLTASCGQSDTQTSVKRAYQLCPKSEDARARLLELAKAYAAQHQAQVFDRGAEAQKELVSIKSEVLRSTRLPLVLLTIDKPKAFRVSITNAGLKEKIGLSIRAWKNSDGEAAAFLNQVTHFWSVEEVQGGVSNDPPCPPF